MAVLLGWRQPPLPFPFSRLPCPLLLPRQCREGAALWKVLRLNDSYDLEKHLDISQVREASEGCADPSCSSLLL